MESREGEDEKLELDCLEFFHLKIDNHLSTALIVNALNLKVNIPTTLYASSMLENLLLRRLWKLFAIYYDQRAEVYFSIIFKRILPSSSLTVSPLCYWNDTRRPDLPREWGGNNDSLDSKTFTAKVMGRNWIARAVLRVLLSFGTCTARQLRKGIELRG